MTSGDAAKTWESFDTVKLWSQGAARRALVLGPVTERMLDAAGLQPGFRVLDLAAGSGDQTLPAARRVLQGGSVLAVDISPLMLQQAQEAARSAGLSNVETLVSDGSSLDLPSASFDAAISRLGLMFMSDLHQALQGVHRALKPGARLAAIVWSSREHNPYFGFLVDEVQAAGRLPAEPPSIIRAMSLGDASRLEHVLQRAGFSQVRVEAVPIVRHFDSVQETVTMMREGSTAAEELMRDMRGDERDAVWASIAHRLEAFVDASGRCTVPGETLLAVGTR